MSNKLFRQVVRWLHLIEGAVLGLYFYSPWGGEGTLLEASIVYFFFPALVISGILLWQQPRVMKLFRGQKAAA